jgi:AmmeMemoRadiSam system protein B/AmmeMemoRadiSam system protein A
VREAAVAGLFYPAQRDRLTQRVDKLLAEAEPAGIKRLRALVAPHAGYDFSGPTAAVAYKQLAGLGFRTVLVMAPSHYAAFEGVFVPQAAAYETPLGRMAVSTLADRLALSPPFTARPSARVMRPSWWRQSPKKPPQDEDDTPDTWEHSLEVQIPFLQRVGKDLALVPMVFGAVDPKAVADVLAGHLDDKTLLVASSDLSHHFTQEGAKKLDTACIEAICQLNPGGITTDHACGRLPVCTLIHVARQKGWKAKRLDYRTSGDTSGDRSAVVGYAAIAWYDPSDGQTSQAASSTGLTSEDRAYLLQLARKTVESAVRGGQIDRPEITGMPPALTGLKGCFVTLTEDGRLRGCIGHVFPQEPLVHAVIGNATSAALRDPRFRPVAPEELDRIDLEVSVLTVPEPLEFRSPEELLAKLRAGIDGVVLQKGPRQSTYLPQVWEQIPDKESFLGELSLKAGLDRQAWKGPDAKVLVYQVEAFGQKSHAQSSQK